MHPVDPSRRAVVEARDRAVRMIVVVAVDRGSAPGVGCSRRELTELRGASHADCCLEEDGTIRVGVDVNVRQTMDRDRQMKDHAHQMTGHDQKILN